MKAYHSGVPAALGLLEPLIGWNSDLDLEEQAGFTIVKRLSK